MFKVDLHTHSMISHDGGITESEYEYVVEKGVLDQIAITDHNKIEFALHMNKVSPQMFIVGEEIMTKDGEIIGLFLEKHIPPDLSIIDTIRKIKEQGGIVYIPHPFDMRRSGVGDKLFQFIDQIDVIEVFNARTLTRSIIDLPHELELLDGDVSYTVGSDSHGITELGTTYSSVENRLTAENIKGQLSRSFDKREYRLSRTSFRGFLNPTINRLKKIFK